MVKLLCGSQRDWQIEIRNSSILQIGLQIKRTTALNDYETYIILQQSSNKDDVAHKQYLRQRTETRKSVKRLEPNDRKW